MAMEGHIYWDVELFHTGPKGSYIIQMIGPDSMSREELP